MKQAMTRPAIRYMAGMPAPVPSAKPYGTVPTMAAIGVVAAITKKAIWAVLSPRLRGLAPGLCDTVFLLVGGGDQVGREGRVNFVGGAPAGAHGAVHVAVPDGGGLGARPVD